MGWGASLAGLLVLAPGPGPAPAPVLAPSRYGSRPGPRSGPPTCKEMAAGAGQVAGEATGRIDASLTGEAFFTLLDGPAGSKALLLTLTEPQTGRWEMRFTIPALHGLPATGDLTVAPADSAAAPARTKTAAATGSLYMFDADALRDIDFGPRSGTLSLDEVSADGVCGRFDVFWDGPEGGAVRTRGTFEAVDSGLGGAG